MPFGIPDEAVATYGAQAAPDSVDIDAIIAGNNGYGLVTGGAVTPGGSLSSSVAAGVALSNGLQVPFATTTLNHQAADPNHDRRDIIVVSSAGVLSIVQGNTGGAVAGVTPAGSRDPVKPNIPAGSVLLAEVYIPAGGTTVAAGWIIDKRVTPESPYTVPFSSGGVQTVQSFPGRYTVEQPRTIKSVRATLGTAPAGSSFIVDVKKNGTSIYTTTANRPTIAAGANTALNGGAPDTNTLAAGDYITVAVLQVGSSTAGSDLVVTVVLA